MKIKSSGDLTEFNIRFPSTDKGGAEILKAILARAGIPETAVAEQACRGKTCLTFYSKNARDTAIIKRKLARLPLSGFQTDCRVLRRQEWQETWKDAIRPFALTGSFDVVPVWQRENYRPGKRVPLYIDTTLSFGTGLHETTRFMAQLLERCRGRFDSFIDIGTGTGILALVAYHCGARAIDVLDISRDCVATAKNNLRLNRVPLRRAFRADIAKPPVGRVYGYVAVNLTTRDLIPACKTLEALTAPGGYLALSGTALEHLDELRQAYASPALRCLKIIRGREWAAVLYKKPSLRPSPGGRRSDNEEKFHSFPLG